MGDSYALHSQVQSALERGWNVLTANQRAARTLHHDFDMNQRALGRSHWEPPAIHAWDEWLGNLWNRLLLDGHAAELLLSPVQEHTIWRAIIAAESASGSAASSLRPVDSLAELAAEAWRLLHEYRGRRRLAASLANSDTRAFARWAAEFERRCSRSQYLTRAQLPEALLSAVSAGQLSLPIGTLLVGFDTRTPAQLALFETMRAADVSVEDLQVGNAASSLTLANAPDERAELDACACWLRAQLSERPTSRIAVVVPAVESNRAEIDRAFRQRLAPELNEIEAPTHSGPYEFSLGGSLAQTAMVSTALDLLRWASGPLPLDRVSALLLSPHFAVGSSTESSSSPNAVATAASSEELARAEFDAFVLCRQQLLLPEITLDELATMVAHSRQSAKLPDLQRRLNALRPIFRSREIASGERAHADWAEMIHELLTAAGWAARSRDNSVEFQTRRKWESALDELATLGFDSRSDGTRVPFPVAVAALTRIAAQTLFAPESRHAPIQIIGPLESAGSTFDAVWFLRANDLSWPQNPSPTPLLPWTLQRELAMPGADPAHDTAHARRITERIAASAPTVVFSYAQDSATEGHQRPSPVVSGLATGSLELRSAEQIAPIEAEFEPIALQAFADDGPAPPPDRVLEGGASILAAQAVCGFRAFAEKRLFASALEPASLGLDPRQRGSLVHTVLELFWAAVETQAALRLLTADERDGMLAHLIDAALAELYPNPARGWPSAYLDAERQRLLKLLRLWLDYEADERSPFTVVSREETLRDVRIGPMRLNIRVDRVDRVPLQPMQDDGELETTGEVILDYKTGLASTADWLGERPDAPQLPLYAVVSATAKEETTEAGETGAPNLAGIAFASLRLGKDMGLHGYETCDGVLPKAAKMKMESLEAQVEEWRKVLTALAEEFYSGEARVWPKQYPKSCNYCDQRLLCRLDPAKLNAAATNTDDDSDGSTDTEAVLG
ncbi:MAG: PD-(D/E)XK nuclease family protein [Acidobacteriaceae bacterium]|nr:PD-(D/E)XK nuclease family protein [Acidobacteriaceae bacterium]